MLSWLRAAVAGGGWLIALAALVGGALLAGWLKSEFWPLRPQIGAEPQIIRLETEPKIIREIRTEVRHVPVEVKVPTAGEAAEVAEETGRDTSEWITREEHDASVREGRELRGVLPLGTRELPRAPYGGEVDVSIRQPSGEVKWDFELAPPPRFELLGRRYVGGGVIYDGAGEEPIGGHASIRIDALRLQRTELGARGGVRVLDGEVTPYAEVSLWWGF